jgi:hypothetical protein
LQQVAPPVLLTPVANRKLFNKKILNILFGQLYFQGLWEDVREKKPRRTVPLTNPQQCCHIHIS